MRKPRPPDPRDAVKSRRTGRPKIPLITSNIADLEKNLPNKEIVLANVMYWMDLGATAQEIAGSHYVSVDTLDRRLKEFTGMSFADLREKVCGGAKLKLRNNQFKMSENNATMAIWLGKQWLGQKETTDVNLTTDNQRDFEAILKKFEQQQEAIKKEENVQ